MDRDEAIEQLMEIRENMETLLDEARLVLRGFPGAEARAEAYWLSHIAGALDGTGSMVGLQDTIDELAEAEREEAA